MIITPYQLHQVIPGCPDISNYAAGLSDAANQFNIGGLNPIAFSFWIAQGAYECNQGMEMVEPNGNAYEGRIDLGNTQPGDGNMYRGRGWLQNTGREIYTLCSSWLHVDLVGNPDLMGQYPWCFLGSAFFWNWKANGRLQAAANAGDFYEVTRLINGGPVVEPGARIDIRQNYLERVQRVLST